MPELHKTYQITLSHDAAVALCAGQFSIFKNVLARQEDPVGAQICVEIVRALATMRGGEEGVNEMKNVMIDLARQIINDE